MRGDKRFFKSGDGRNRKFNLSTKKDLRSWLQREERPDDQNFEFETFKDDFDEGRKRSRSGGKHSKGSRDYDEFNLARNRFSPPDRSHLEGRSRSPRFFKEEPRSHNRSRSRGSRSRKAEYDSHTKFSPPHLPSRSFGGAPAQGNYKDRHLRSRSREADRFGIPSKFSPPHFDREPVAPEGPFYDERYPSDVKETYSRDFPPDFHEPYPRDTILKEREIILDDNIRRPERGYSPDHFHEYPEQEPANQTYGSNAPKYRDRHVAPSWEKSKAPERAPEEKPQNENELPEFNPEASKLSAKQWIKLIEQFAKNRQLGDDEKRFHMTSRLAGFARQWYLSTGKNISRWSDLKVKFTQSFPSEMDYCMHLTDMLNRKKRSDESMVSYFDHKVALLNACDITGAKAVSCIIGGLTDDRLRRTAKDEDFNNVNSLLEFLRSKESEKNHAQEKEMKDDMDMDKKHEGITCFKCGKVGHIARKCVSSNVCSYCDKKGHFEAECKIKADDEAVSRSSNKVMYGALADNPTYPQYFKEVSVNGNYMKAYIDFSSETVTIREEVVAKLGLQYQKMYKVIRSFGGSPVSCVGELEATFSVDEAVARVKAYIVPDHIQAVPVILGQAFTKQPHIAITGDGDNILILQRSGGSSHFLGSMTQSSHYY